MTDHTVSIEQIADALRLPHQKVANFLDVMEPGFEPVFVRNGKPGRPKRVYKLDDVLKFVLAKTPHHFTPEFVNRINLYAESN